MTTDTTAGAGTVAARLRQARLARGWTLGSVAYRLAVVAEQAGVVVPDGVTLRAVLDRWETGQTVPGVQYARLVCAVFECDPGQLGLPDVRPDPPPPRT